MCIFESDTVKVIVLCRKILKYLKIKYKLLFILLVILFVLDIFKKKKKEKKALKR